MGGYVLNQVMDLGDANLPTWAGLRVMHMPFRFEDVETLPQVGWRKCVESLLERWPGGRPVGVGYITIDQKVVEAGLTHRRPGVHVDGGASSGWGGGYPGGSWGGRSKPRGFGGSTFGANGFVLAASHHACDAWDEQATGVGDDGQCDVPSSARIQLSGGRAFWLAPDAPHEPLPLTHRTKRTVLRLSAPNNSPWYEGYTENPSVAPAGPIHLSLIHI